MKAEKIIAAPFTPPLHLLLRPKSEGGGGIIRQEFLFFPLPRFTFFGRRGGFDRRWKNEKLTGAARPACFCP